MEQWKGSQISVVPLEVMLDGTRNTGWRQGRVVNGMEGVPVCQCCFSLPKRASCVYTSLLRGWDPHLSQENRFKENVLPHPWLFYIRERWLHVGLLPERLFSVLKPSNRGA